MTENELNQLFYLNKERERLKREIQAKKARVGYKSPGLSDMSKGPPHSYTDDVDEIADLEAIMVLNLKQIQRERAKLERYIGAIRDAEARLIVRLRHVNCMTWEEIGAELHMDRRTVSRKYNSHLKNAHNAR